MANYCEPIHATALVHKGIGCLIIGESGTGKSRLLAEALLHGASLIADDRVRLCGLNGKLVASAPPKLEGVIELRGLGLIKRNDPIHSHPIHLIVELTEAAAERVPEAQTREYQGVSVPYVQLLPPPMLSVASLLLYLQAVQEGRVLSADWRPDV